MKCIKCGSNMYVDDVDYHFEGNKDVYYVCENDNCRVSCIKKIRYSKTYKEEWVLSESEPPIIINFFRK